MLACFRILCFNAEEMKLLTPQTAPPRKLRTPGPMPSAPVRVAAPVQPEPPAPCAAPRCRFTRCCVIVFAILSLVGSMIAFGAEGYNSKEPLSLKNLVLVLYSFFSYIIWLYGPVFGILCFPVRTSRGSLIQLLCLPVPLLLAIWNICFCWDCWGDDSMDSLAYAMGLGMIYVLGLFYWYLPLWGLHGLLSWLEHRARRKARL